MVYRILREWGETNKENIRLPFRHHVYLEVIWSLLPGYLLLMIVQPSFTLLYIIDELVEPCITLKL